MFVDRPSRRRRDVLPPVHRITDGRSAMPRAGLKTPHFLTRACIQREELAFRIAGEHQVARRRQHGSQQYVFVRIAPDALAESLGPRHPRDCRSRDSAAASNSEFTAHEKSAFVRFLMLRRNVHCKFRAWACKSIRCAANRPSRSSSSRPPGVGQKFIVLPSSGSRLPTSFPSSVMPVIQVRTSGTLNTPTKLARYAIQHKRHAALVHVDQQLSHPPVDHAIH